MDETLPSVVKPSELTEANLDTPGVGMAGKVICPLMSIGKPFPQECIKQACEFWMPLHMNVVKKPGAEPKRMKVARCCLTWIPFLQTEVRQSIDKLAEEAKIDNA